MNKPIPYLIKQLKGGSLNSTNLYQQDDIKFVRKLISTQAHREYGYVRWYSQLKKLQRYQQLIPDLVPKILDTGVTDAGVYFDIEFVDAQDIKTLFLAGVDDVMIQKIHTELWHAFDQLHSNTYPANTSSLQLYFQEEVLQKINDSRKFLEFEEFYQIDNYQYTSGTVSGMKTISTKFEKLFNQTIHSECYVHGNPTLENILYSDDTGITFIDLYEEGIVDSNFMDYSQVLQCANSHYGMLNDGELLVNENVVSNNVYIPLELYKFNKLFDKEIRTRFSLEEYRLVKLFEATQFFRMLPFKCHSGNFISAKYFYVHACNLVNSLL